MMSDGGNVVRPRGCGDEHGVTDKKNDGWKERAMTATTVLFMHKSVVHVQKWHFSVKFSIVSNSKDFPKENGFYDTDTPHHNTLMTKPQRGLCFEIKNECKSVREI